MKVRNWRKKLAATLVSCGLLAPGVAAAADLNANLILNPGFENVDLFSVSYYNAPLILDWGFIVPGFAYSHTLAGEMVPDFANGGPLSGGGDWYFSPGNGGNDSFENAIFQDIDVSTGASGTAIAGGGATFNLSAFFSTYDSQADRAIVQVDFFNSQTQVIGTAQISTPLNTVLSTWTQFSTSGAVPAGTTLVQVSSWGEVFAGSGGSPDGYQDNLDFRIIGSVNPNADFNSVNGVDGADLLVWQRFLGTTAGATRAMGNSNPTVDGDVDAGDLATWKAQFGTAGGAAVAAAAVPEPTGATILGACVGAMSGIRRRRAEN
jgi:hypothetical protein